MCARSTQKLVEIHNNRIFVHSHNSVRGAPLRQIYYLFYNSGGRHFQLVLYEDQPCLLNEGSAKNIIHSAMSGYQEEKPHMKRKPSHRYTLSLSAPLSDISLSLSHRILSLSLSLSFCPILTIYSHSRNQKRNRALLRP